MEKVFEKFKNLYKGEEWLKRHGMLLLLLLLPAIAGSMRYIVDKDTSKEILIPALCVMCALLVFSIIPGFFLNGFCVDFYKSRIKSKLGLPKVTGETFVKGLKVFPLQLVWGIYACIPIVILVGILISCTIGSGIMSSKSGAIGSFILVIFAIIILYLLLMLLYLIIAPFFNYIYLSFIEDFVYRAEYFNPLTLWYCMKTVFKETMITMLKFLLSSLVINTVVQTVVVLVVLIVGIFAGIMSAAIYGNADSVITPVSIIILLPACALAGLTQAYTTTIIGLAAGDAYTDIYKEHLRLPDPAEKHQDDFKDLSI